MPIRTEEEKDKLEQRESTPEENLNPQADSPAQRSQKSDGREIDNTTEDDKPDRAIRINE